MTAQNENEETREQNVFQSFLQESNIIRESNLNPNTGNTWFSRDSNIPQPIRDYVNPIRDSSNPGMSEDDESPCIMWK